MARGRYGPIGLTCAVTGGDVLPSQSRAIPCSVDAIVRESIAAVDAGASIVHLHAREPDGRPSGSAALFVEMVQGIRSARDTVLSISTGGAPGMSAEERIAGVQAVRPEIGTLNLGTMNYEGYPTKSRWPLVNTDWEQRILDSSGQVVFRNTLGMIRDFAAEFRRLGVTPELEVYDVSHLAMARFLLDEGTLEGPVRVQLVLGVLGGVQNGTEDLMMLYQAANRILGPDLGVLGVASTGYPGQFRIGAVALGLGLDCRVGLEDSLRITREKQASSNADLVLRAVELAQLLGRPLATAGEVRSELGPWWRAADVVRTLGLGSAMGVTGR